MALVVYARPGDSSAAVADRRRRVRRDSHEDSTRARSTAPGISDRRKLGRGASSRWCTRGAVTVIMPSDHTASSVSNEARLGEREAKIGWPLHCPQNARRGLPSPTSGLPRRHSTRRGDAPPLRARPRSRPHTSHPRAPSQTKGTSSFGKRHSKTHTTCRRCGKVSFHLQKKVCASCGYPGAKMRRFNWSEKALRRRTNGTGRMRHRRHMPRRFKNGYREGTQAKAAKSVAASA